MFPTGLFSPEGGYRGLGRKTFSGGECRDPALKGCGQEARMWLQSQKWMGNTIRGREEIKVSLKEALLPVRRHAMSLTSG
jgi:hypothetical protein